MNKRSLSKLLALLFAFALVAAACGGDSDTSDETTDTTAGDTDAGGDEEEEPIAAGEEAEGDVDTEVEEVEGERTYGGSIAVGLEAEAVGLRPWEDTCSSPCYNMMITIYDKLAEADITIAFPQRDVHLDINGPLDVRLGEPDSVERPPPRDARPPWRRARR